jgi:hypothetical protein
MLAILSATHISKGVYYLAIERPTSAIADLRNRRIENAYFLDRVSPLSQQSLALTPANPDRWSAGADPRWTHGAENARGALPPWTYPLQLAVALPGDEWPARLYLTLLSVIALAAIAWLANQRVDGTGATHTSRLLVVLSPLAIGANNIALTQGQNSLVVNACLAAVLIGLTRRRQPAPDVGGGIAFAFAMMKPSSAVLFAIVPLLKRRWLMLASSGAVLAAATAFASWWLRHPVAFQFEQFERLTRWVVDEGANPALNVLSRATSASVARNLFGVAGMAAAVVAAYRLRAASPFAMFAVLAVVSRLFTYHRAYDDVLLAFLLIELGGRAWAPRRARRWQLAWFAGGLSLWLPYSWYLTVWAQTGQVLTWAALATAVALSDGCERGESNPHSLSATGS